MAIFDGYTENMKVNVANAKNKLPELIKAVEAGLSVTICRRGVPVADLVRTKKALVDKPKFGSLKGRLAIKDSDWWKPMSEAEVKAFMSGHY
jgi:prevent-host-death family protein